MVHFDQHQRKERKERVKWTREDYKEIIQSYIYYAVQKSSKYSATNRKERYRERD